MQAAVVAQPVPSQGHSRAEHVTRRTQNPAKPLPPFPPPSTPDMLPLLTWLRTGLMN